jgi:AraC family transcriptional regulator, regulatory protein of adaptative response / methylated-DNA-[protein]-cysteine methyltransferase
MKNDYEQIEKAIHFIRSNVSAQPKLDDVASYVGLSPFHCQRLFRRWAGVSPKRFLEYLTVDHAKELLSRSRSVLDASYSLGLSSAGRLHDHFISIEAITPGEYKTHGAGLQIHYGIHSSPFGTMLLAQTSRGVCALSFVDADSLQVEINALCKRWPNADIVEDVPRTAMTANKIFAGAINHAERIHLAVRGTNFQIKVWKALLDIPAGHISSYQQIAEKLNMSGAYRAVANAIGANPVGYLIPCHRVLRSSGEVGGYRWGVARKHAMIVWETAKYAPYDNDDDGNIYVYPGQTRHG